MPTHSTNHRRLALGAVFPVICTGLLVSFIPFSVIAAETSQPKNSSVPDAQTIVRRSVERDWTDYGQIKNYTYQQKVDRREFDSAGHLSHTTSETREMMVLAGRPYQRVIAHDGKPLSERDAQKEQAKADRELAKRQRESPSDRARDEREREEDRRFIREIPDAFNFHFVGTETVSGQPTWIVDAEPKPGYRPKQSKADVFTKVRAKIWIEQSTYHWVKVDAEALDMLSFGWGLVRVARGASMHFEQKRVNDEIWLPSSAVIRADARLALVKKLRAEFDVRYSDYRKFQSDSRMEGVSEAGLPESGTKHK